MRYPARQPYQYDMSTIPNLLMQGGDIQAQRTANKYGILGQTLSDLGRIVGQGIQQRGVQELAAQEKGLELENQRLQNEQLRSTLSQTEMKRNLESQFLRYASSGKRDPRELLALGVHAFGPDRGPEIVTAFLATTGDTPMSPKEQTEALGASLVGIAGLEDASFMEAAPTTLEKWGPKLQKDYGYNIDMATLQAAQEQGQLGAIKQRAMALGRSILGQQVEPPAAGSLEEFASETDPERRAQLLKQQEDWVAARKTPEDPLQAERDRIALAAAQTNLETARFGLKSKKEEAAAEQRWSELPAEWVDVTERIVGTMAGVKQPGVRKQVQRLLEAGDTEELAGYLRKTALWNENVDLKNQLLGRASIISALTDAEQIIQDFASEGLDLGLLTGTMEEISQRLGKSSDPRLAYFKARIDQARIAYRRAATGVQFNQLEDQQYARQFPSNGKELTLNLALIRGLRDAMSSNDYSYWQNLVGGDGARLLGITPPGTSGYTRDSGPSAQGEAIGRSTKPDGVYQSKKYGSVRVQGGMVYRVE